MSEKSRLFARTLLLCLATWGLLVVALPGCKGVAIRPQAAGSGNATMDCGACKRMCEKSGDAENNPGAVDNCKKDCDRKCK
jgi:hypothetical protein